MREGDGEAGRPGDGESGTGDWKPATGSQRRRDRGRGGPFSRRIHAAIATSAFHKRSQLPENRIATLPGVFDDGQSNHLARFDVLCPIGCDVAGMCEPLAQQEWPDAQRSAASGVEFGRLERSEHAGLRQGVDPDRVEPRQVLSQPPDAPSHPRHLFARGYSQAFQRSNQFYRRQFGHGFICEELAGQARYYGKVKTAVFEILDLKSDNRPLILGEVFQLPCDERSKGSLDTRLVPVPSDFSALL